MLSVSSKRMPAPTLLRSLCDGCEQDGKLADEQLQATSASQTWPISVPHNKRRSPAKSLERYYQYYSSWLQRAIRFSFSLSTGAGGFSIAAALHLNAVLAPNNWASYRLWDLVMMNRMLIPIFKMDMDHLIHDFQAVFSAGEVTPSDMLIFRGNTYSLVDVWIPPKLS